MLSQVSKSPDGASADEPHLADGCLKCGTFSGRWAV